MNLLFLLNKKIEFYKSSGRYDSFSPLANTCLNGLLLAGTSFAAGVVTSVALKALGYSQAGSIIGSFLKFSGVTTGLTIAALAAFQILRIGKGVHESIGKAL